MSRYQQINSTARARRAIARLAKNNGVDVRLVEIAAKLTWDYDPASRNESKGWVAQDDELLTEAAHDLAIASVALGFPANRRVSQREATAEVLERLEAVDSDVLLEGFLRGAAEHDAGAVSEFATTHYLRGATVEKLACLTWRKDLTLAILMRQLFVKLFRAGSMDRDGLAYVYADLAFDVSDRQVGSPASNWLPVLADRIQSLGEGSSLTDLIRCTKGLIAGGKYFKQTVLEALAFARVLRVQGVGEEVFLPAHRGELSKHFYSNEWRFPLRLWSERAGRVDWHRVEELSC